MTGMNEVITLEMHDVWGFLNSGIFLLLCGAIGRYIKRIADRADEEKAHREQLLKELTSNNERLTADVRELKERYERLEEKLADMQTTMNNVANGGLAMLKDRLLQSCNYFIKRGSITLTAKNNLKSLYHYYHDVFHQNGDGQEYYETMCQLPVEDMPIISKFDLDISKAGEKHYE